MAHIWSHQGLETRNSDWYQINDTSIKRNGRGYQRHR
jgi:hypothetical protein